MEFVPGVLQRLPVRELCRVWSRSWSVLWPLSAFLRHRVLRALAAHAVSGRPDPARDLQALQTALVHDEAARSHPLFVLADPVLGGSRVIAEHTLAQVLSLRGSLAVLSSMTADPEAFQAASSALVEPAQGPLGEVLSRHLACHHAFTDALARFVPLAGARRLGGSVAAFQTGLQAIGQHRARLAEWSRWMSVRSQASREGLGALVHALESGSSWSDPGREFERAYAKWWLPLAMDASEPLRRFTRSGHGAAVASFQALDEQAMRTASEEIRRRIAHALPSREEVVKSSALGVLRHQLTLTRPSMPVRRLLSQLCDCLPQLVPCMLMSPMSVAQYLPRSHPGFDLVIFDEASQIPVWDAVGVMARARQSIIVGDPKQLPPTSFFARSGEADEWSAVDTDLDSILDEAIAVGVSSHRLAWHYRSRDESLIAFSNRFYYQGSLVTFPAPRTASPAVHLHPVQGIYDRGRSRTNALEAKAVSQFLVPCLKSLLEVEESARSTFAVITFNTEQQSVILDDLDRSRRADPRLEWFFAEERAEPVIVKNLEEIQGDERDVVLFSTTFGPDRDGAVSMNFGPLNADGGERRLNVAITRARHALHVFSSIGADRIDLARTRSFGVRDLKAFLDYADRGVESLPRLSDVARPRSSPLPEALGACLVQLGWQVHAGVGVSGTPIDLAIVHPARSTEYLLGIEFDGPGYRHAASVRDRDKVRCEVLTGLGWSLERVWSPDWFRDRAGVVQRIDERARALVS